MMLKAGCEDSIREASMSAREAGVLSGPGQPELHSHSLSQRKRREFTVRELDLSKTEV